MHHLDEEQREAVAGMSSREPGEGAWIRGFKVEEVSEYSSARYWGLGDKS